MTDIMTLNYLFYLGIIIPCVITVALFIVFLFCWNKHRIRKEIMTKKHDPHRKFKGSGSLAGSESYYRVPRPPLPPKWIYRSSNSQDSQCILPHHNEAFDLSPDTLSQEHNRQIYNTFHDSGMSDLSEMQCRYEQQRPNSQASTDSEDSGFRSSRSGQYLHSAQNSNAQELPLFKPISSNKESVSQQQTVNLVSSDKTRNPSRHSKRKNKSPNNVRTKEECLHLNENHTELKSPPLSVISPKMPKMGHLTFTTATVHHPRLDDRGPPMAYSVV